MYDLTDVVAVMVVGGMAFLTILICYIVESVFLAKIALKRGKNPLFAWIPVVNYFLLRDMVVKKSRWQWLLGFFLAALLGNTVVRFIGMQALVWSMMVWYWGAFYTLMKEETELVGLWFMGAIFCFPIKLYVMYKMAE